MIGELADHYMGQEAGASKTAINGADAGGLTYSSGELVNGTASRGTLGSAILSAAHAFKRDATWGWVANLLDNKVAIAKEIAINLGLSYLSGEESIVQGMAIAAAVTPANTSIALGLVGVSSVHIDLV